MNAGLFNACDYLLDRHVREGRGGRLALTTATGKIRRMELRAQAAVILQDDKVAL